MTYSHLATIPLIGSLQVEHFQLHNGLQVAVVEDPTTPIFTYQTWFKVGSADERAGKQGLAHLFEHMMFRTTKNLEMGKWEREVNRNGGTGINAYTSRDQTVYFFTFPKEKFDLAARLESERMSNLVIEPEMFETEKGAVLTERNRGLDNPGRFLWEELYKLTYEKHNYRYSIIGEEESIKNFSVKEAQSFYKTFYSPNNSLIIVAGDVKAQSCIEILDKYYGEFNSIAVSSRPFIEESAQVEPKALSLLHNKATQKMIAKTWLTKNMLHKDFPALYMAGKLLSGQKSSILQQRLFNTAKARNVHADIYTGKDNGTFEFFAEVAKGEEYDSIEKIFQEALDEIISGKISEDQLFIVKNFIEKDFYFDVSSPSSLARMLGDGFIMADDLAYQCRLVEKFKDVTMADIQRVVNEYLIEGKSSTVYLSPA
ncbi:MAG: pitrilysin family protein [Bacteroidota bacterium]|nr:pitrilysin family protein [Bacteroidota bacterium]